MKILSSKFSILPIILCFLFTSILIVPLFVGYPYDKAELIFLIFGPILLVFFWMTEFRTKAHKIQIQSGAIKVRKFFGLGKLQEYKWSDVKGFIITKQTGGTGRYEYIFIINDKKRLVSVSAFYHRNYVQLRSEIEKKTPFLGEREFGFSKEYIEMFK